jgi:type II secretory pathway pseudopilin PulG
MSKPLPTRRPKPSEEGYILVAVMFMLALLVIAMSVAAPRIAKSIQRERELETMRRGKQYVRAIKLYYRKFRAYPPNVDALVKTNDIRFLRKKYIDPTTGKDEWKIIHVGEQKTQTLGFFGQPLVGGNSGGLTPIGTGPQGANGQTGLSPIGGFGSSSSNSGFSSGTTDNGNGNGTTGNPTDPSSGANGASGTSGTGQNGTGGATGGTGTTGSFGNGQTFGGIGIMGVSPNNPKQSILVYKKKNHYNEWEFLYDPISEQTMQGGNAGTIGTPVGNSPIGTPGITGSPTPAPAPTPQPQQ